MTSLLSRADLLRALRAAPDACAEQIGDLLGFTQRATAPTRSGDSDSAPAIRPDATIGRDDRVAPSASTAPPLYTAKRTPRYWVVTRCEPVDEESATDGDDHGDEPEPPPGKRTAIAPLAWWPLFNPGQWQNLWDGNLPARHSRSAIDPLRTVRRLSRGEPLQRMERKVRHSWNHSTVLLVERSRELRPLWRDFDDCEASLLALLGEDQFSCYWLDSGPNVQWLRSGGEAAASDADIPAGATVLMIGAFGGLESGKVGDGWRALMRRLKPRVHALVALPVRPLRGVPGSTCPLDTASGEMLNALFAALSQVWLPDATQLRRLRGALPGACLADELLAWNDPALQRDGEWLVAPAAVLLDWLARFERLDDSLRERIRQLVDGDEWLGSLGNTVRQIERLQRELRSKPRPDDYEALKSLVARCKTERERTRWGGGNFRLIYSALAVSEALMDSGAGPEWSKLLEEFQQVALLTNKPLPRAHRGLDNQTAVQYLRQIGDCLHITNSPDLAIMPLSREPFDVSCRQRLAARTRPPGHRFEIVDQGCRWELSALARPAWAVGMRREASELFAVHESGHEFGYRPAGEQRAVGQWGNEDQPMPGTVDTGVDEYGLWADIELAGVRQRLRWIPPGEFSMGSPETEPERRDDETQHTATLTRGYWLGDTTVTQALWQAVMDRNPSRFKSDSQNPVEHVSWHDCQQFIDRANTRLPDGLQLSLPSEAEWEYACRAGSKTAFSWGDELTTGRANYDGNYPYNKGPKGEYRKRTVPVKSFRPNPWGLHQMHGNVWEWVADWDGDYPAESATDPKGPASGRKRVLRGGSWSFDGRYLRAAYRFALVPGERSSGIGLRLAGGLTKPETSQPASERQRAGGRRAEPPASQRAGFRGPVGRAKKRKEKKK